MTASTYHRPRKRFGQNFLHDPAIIRRIVDKVRPRPEDHLIEIGPGQGAITTALLRSAGRLEAIELDRDLIAPLTRRCADLGEFVVHNEDALQVDLCALASPGGLLRIVGNLPYNVSTPLLFRFLDQAACIQDLHLMLQKEVVDRIVSGPGSKVYGRLSVMIQTWCCAECLFIIKPGAFHPQPKVDSAFLRLVPQRPPRFTIADRAFHARLVAKAFSQRRKTLRNSLKGLVDVQAMESLDIDPGSRAEELDVGAYAALANFACKSGKQP
jgi:16S rRNA (adenine1518-N6/adenine1519-N6)-dimethyltransferase